MTPEQTLVAQALANAGQANIDALEYVTRMNRRKLIKTIRELRAAGHLEAAGKSRFDRQYIFRLTSTGQKLVDGPKLIAVSAGRQLYTTLLNARVKFCPPVDDHRNAMARPTYETPRLQTPVRAGAMDAYRLPSKGM